MFPPSESGHMATTRKFDWGATCSGVNVANLAGEPPCKRASFAKARGIHARLEPGDSLFVPKGYWHSVVALSPSVSISVFGMTALEQATRGLLINFLYLVHAMGLYRWGWCTVRRRFRDGSRLLASSSPPPPALIRCQPTSQCHRNTAAPDTVVH